MTTTHARGGREAANANSLKKKKKTSSHVESFSAISHRISQRRDLENIRMLRRQVRPEEPSVAAPYYPDP